MESNIVKVVCKVCGGAGGWEKKKETDYDDSWSDCLYCDSYGFYEEEITVDNESILLKYIMYKTKITEGLTETLAVVESFSTVDFCKTIEIKIIPYSKGTFGEFVKFAVKLGRHSERLTVTISQEYDYRQDFDKIFYQWRVVLEPESIEDLDGFVDLIDMWKGRSSGVKRN